MPYPSTWNYAGAAKDYLLRRIETAWPDASYEDCVFVGPIGSRHDVVIYNRKTGRVTTGTKEMQGSPATKTSCFEGTLDELEDAVNKKYGYATGLVVVNAHSRFYAEYKAAILFFHTCAITSEPVQP